MGLSTRFEDVEPSRADIDALAGPTVLEFGTPWCGYCQAAQPLIARAFERHAGVRHIKVEDGPGRSLGRSFRIKLWPTLIFLHNGTETARLVRPTEVTPIALALAQLTSDDIDASAIRAAE
jgi:thioredoxin 1